MSELTLNFQFSILNSIFYRSCGPRRADLSVTNKDKDVDKMPKWNIDMTQIEKKTYNNNQYRFITVVFFMLITTAKLLPSSKPHNTAFTVNLRYFNSNPTIVLKLATTSSDSGKGR